MPELVAVQVRVVYSSFVLYFVHASCALLIAGARAAGAVDPVRERDGGIAEHRAGQATLRAVDLARHAATHAGDAELVGSHQHHAGEGGSGRRAHRQRRNCRSISVLHEFCVLCISYQVARFVEQMVQGMWALGITVNVERPPIFSGNIRDVGRLMVQAAKVASEMAGGARPQLILIMKPNVDQASYFAIKKLGDTELGIPTQCCIEKHIFKCSRQYIQNVILKINCKLGGINSTLVHPLPKCSSSRQLSSARM